MGFLEHRRINLFTGVQDPLETPHQIQLELRRRLGWRIHDGAVYGKDELDRVVLVRVTSSTLHCFHASAILAEIRSWRRENPNVEILAVVATQAPDPICDPYYDPFRRDGVILLSAIEDTDNLVALLEAEGIRPASVFEEAS